jgi:uncharacterized membrane protein YgcG
MVCAAAAHARPATSARARATAEEPAGGGVVDTLCLLTYSDTDDSEAMSGALSHVVPTAAAHGGRAALAFSALALADGSGGVIGASGSSSSSSGGGGGGGGGGAETPEVMETLCMLSYETEG